MKKKLEKLMQRISPSETILSRAHTYLKRYRRYSFSGSKCRDEEQYRAVITRWYHTIEKGLAYTDFRAGFGKKNLDALLTAMENYTADGFDPDAFFYQTAISTLQAYMLKNHACGWEDKKLEERIHSLKGVSNSKGGVISFTPKTEEEVQKLGYADFVRDRHSMRHFSEKRLDPEKIKAAIALAQYTPSACNRQGWGAVVMTDKALIAKVLKNQNGNEGFGQEFDGLILVTADLRCFNRDRELFQIFIDGGMYAQSILNALHCEHIASVPLSASLYKKQEKNIRALLQLKDYEIPIMLIGIGNYPDVCQTTRSERGEPKIRML